jgi:signal transduction histidine kinase
MIKHNALKVDEGPVAANDAGGRTTWRDRLRWVEPFVCGPGEDQEARQRKVLLVVASVLVVPAGLIWGAVYWVYQERAVALFPFAYSALTLLDILVLFRFRRYELFRMIQQFLILALPIAFHLALGGFVGSSAAILWSFLAVLMALLFGRSREAIFWFIAYVSAVVMTAVLQPSVTIDNALPPRLALVFFALNIITVSLLAFVVLHSFVSDRRRLRELEVAYLNREMLLRQSQRLASLGTLAAGIAHELNNPAAATRRAAGQLREAFASLEKAHIRLAVAALTPAGREMLQSLEQQARERALRQSDLDALTRADSEAAVEEWLAARGVADTWELAPPLVGLGLDPPALTRLANVFQAETLGAALAWVASLFPVYSLLNEIGHGSSRISEIVGALKSYSYLGQAPAQAVNLHEGIDNTLVILRNKLKAGVSVRREYGADVPAVPGYGSELNQVWTNLLDNAADALGGKGQIIIRTRCQGAWAVVEIEDDGPGIPAENLPRIFDPFFTTKAPGKGAGLGLSTSYGIVTEKHKGELQVESRPGCTRFTVKLPIEPGAPRAESRPEGRS